MSVTTLVSPEQYLQQSTEPESEYLSRANSLHEVDAAGNLQAGPISLSLSEVFPA